MQGGDPRLHLLVSPGRKGRGESCRESQRSAEGPPQLFSRAFGLVSCVCGEQGQGTTPLESHHLILMQAWALPVLSTRQMLPHKSRCLGNSKAHERVYFNHRIISGRLSSPLVLPHQPFFRILFLTDNI